MIRFGVIGYGYWGPNIVRNINITEGAQLLTVCDKDEKALSRVKKAYPNVQVSTDYLDIIDSPDIDVVAVVTPVSTHYELAKKALQNGKHIFLEKPFTATVPQAEELIELGEKKNLKIMVDHTFLFTSAVRKIKDIIDEGILGDLFYYDSTRVNLGQFQHDVNVIWDLAPHDFSIMDYLMEDSAQAVSASGMAHINEQEDIAYIMVYFGNNLIAHFNVNWLSPVKVRNTFIGGDKKMLVWNDISADEKIKIYDKGIDVTNGEGLYKLHVNYRSGDMWAPRVEQAEALTIEMEYFINCVTENKTPLNDGHAGLRVVRLLEACNKSLSNKGRLVEL